MSETSAKRSRFTPRPLASRSVSGMTSSSLSGDLRDASFCIGTTEATTRGATSLRERQLGQHLCASTWRTLTAGRRKLGAPEFLFSGLPKTPHGGQLRQATGILDMPQRPGDRGRQSEVTFKVD